MLLVVPLLAVLAVLASGPGVLPLQDPEETWTDEELEGLLDPDAEPRKPRKPGESTPRDLRLEALLDELRRTPGWKLGETSFYFVLSNVDDAPFLAELRERLASFRWLVGGDFPHPQADPIPIEIAPSVVRVLSSEEQYFSYGGEGGSRGYYDPICKELVLYRDLRHPDGLARTWSTLQGLLFHEYLRSCRARRAPAWFSLGLADVYRDLGRERETWVVPRFAWHAPDLQRAVAERRHTPLRALLSMSNADFYRSPAPLREQARSLCYFLMGAARSAEAARDADLGVANESRASDTIPGEFARVLGDIFEASRGKAGDADLERRHDAPFVERLEQAWLAWLDGR